jgi:hypothetical protein
MAKSSKALWYPSNEWRNIFMGMSGLLECFVDLGGSN